LKKHGSKRGCNASFHRRKKKRELEGKHEKTVEGKLYESNRRSFDEKDERDTGKSKAQKTKEDRRKRLKSDFTRCKAYTPNTDQKEKEKEMKWAHDRRIIGQIF